MEEGEVLHQLLIPGVVALLVHDRLLLGVEDQVVGLQKPYNAEYRDVVLKGEEPPVATPQQEHVACHGLPPTGCHELRHVQFGQVRVLHVLKDYRAVGQPLPTCKEIRTDKNGHYSSGITKQGQSKGPATR